LATEPHVAVASRRCLRLYDAGWCAVDITRRQFDESSEVSSVNCSDSRCRESTVQVNYSQIVECTSKPLVYSVIHLLSLLMF